MRGRIFRPLPGPLHLQGAATSSGGLRRGPNLVTDGDMEAVGTTIFTAVSANLSKQSGAAVSGAQILRVTKTGAGSGYGYRVCTTIGASYRVTGWARGNGTARPILSDGATTLWTGTTSVAWQAFDVTFVATATAFRMYASMGAAGNYSEWDDVYISLS
jgi:hypothetical protein